jgi:hypothetical protein
VTEAGPLCRVAVSVNEFCEVSGKYGPVGCVRVTEEQLLSLNCPFEMFSGGLYAVFEFRGEELSRGFQVSGGGGRVLFRSRGINVSWLGPRANG